MGYPNVSKSDVAQAGFALPGVIFLMLLAVILGMSSLTASSLDVRASAHYSTGNQSLFAAESGLLHAIGSINTSGAIDFQQDIANRWAEVYGEAAKTFPGDSRVSYTANLVADPSDPKNGGILTVTGSAPLRAQSVISVRLEKDDFTGSPGAIYLANDEAGMDFKGNAFEVNGNDHDRFSNEIPGGLSKPGISTRGDAVRDGVVNTLSSGQMDNVKGEGFSLSPLNPSVLNTGGPSVGDIDQFVTDLLQTLKLASESAIAEPAPSYELVDPLVSEPVLEAPQLDYTLSDGTTYTKTATQEGELLSFDSGVSYLETTKTSWEGNDTLGTLDAPQITHIAADQVRLLGNASGAGILIVDGALDIRGTFDFVGWVIVRGKTTIEADSSLFGNAAVTGSLWTSQLELMLGGSIVVDYCHECLQLVDGISPGNSNAVPRPMRITSWQEVF